MPPKAADVERGLTVSNPRAVLCQELKNLTVRVPNLQHIFAGWNGVHIPVINCHLPALRSAVEERLQGLKIDQVKRTRLEAADFGLFTSLWWPYAPFDRLQILAYLVIWLFSWDDEIDEPSGTHSDDFEAAKAYRAETLRYVHFHLGLSSSASDSITRSPIVQSVDVICLALRKSYNIDQRERVYEEIVRFLAASEQEQKVRLNDELPTLKEYWACRLGTSAVYIGTAFGEYSITSTLPSRIMSHPSMKAVWDETNLIISITNDLLSLRKEMKHGCVDNVVSLAYASTRSIEAALDGSVAALRWAKLRFDQAADSLLSFASAHEDCYHQVASFVEVQRSNCVGNLVWSLQTRRYGMQDCLQEDGSITFIL